MDAGESSTGFQQLDQSFYLEIKELWRISGGRRTQKSLETENIRHRRFTGVPRTEDPGTIKAGGPLKRNGFQGERFRFVPADNLSAEGKAVLQCADRHSGFFAHAVAGSEKLADRKEAAGAESCSGRESAATFQSPSALSHSQCRSPYSPNGRLLLFPSHTAAVTNGKANVPPEATSGLRTGSWPQM